MQLMNLIRGRNGKLGRHLADSAAPSLSLPRLYCAHCGLRLRFNVVEHGERLGIEPTATHCPRCGVLLLGDATIEVQPRNMR